MKNQVSISRFAIRFVRMFQFNFHLGSRLLLAVTVLYSLLTLTDASARPVLGQVLSPAEIKSEVMASLPEALERFRDFLTYPNDANFPDDIDRMLSWLEKTFEEKGFETERWTTPSNPVLFVQRMTPGAQRSVLMYFHADGQPVDPSRWDQASPWEPVLKEKDSDGRWQTIPWESLSEKIDPEWRIFARSASDAKGPIAHFLAAISILDRLEIKPQFHFKIIIDTEEEKGSRFLPQVIDQHRDRLSADMMLIFDGPPHTSNQPSLKFGHRGNTTVTLKTYGPIATQHSGHYGNYLPNPNFRMAKLLASFKDDQGRVLIPGWYDGITLDEATKAILRKIPDDEPAILREMQVAMAEQVGDSLQEAMQYPSLNVRGLSSGYVGKEARTIIPAETIAEIDIRLVPESDSARLCQLLREYILQQGYYLVDEEPTEEERNTHDRIVKMVVNRSNAGFRTPFDSEVGQWLTSAFVHLFNQEPIRIRNSGGSVPIAPFVKKLGISAVTVPTVNPDNNQHAPNENLRLGNFIQGIEIIVAVLQQPFP